MIAARTYAKKAREWLLSNTWAVERITAADEREAGFIINKYVDTDYSYTDATSFALIERLGFDLAFVYNRQFAQYGILTPDGLDAT